MTDRILGLLLFLPVPLVLWLYTRLPFGAIPSLLAGTVLMLTHPLYARPFALRRAGRRCLWCGGSLPEGTSASAHPVVLHEPRGVTTWRACGPDHLQRLCRVLAWAQERSQALRLGIFGTLVLFLPAAALVGTGRLSPLTAQDAVAFFRLGIALTVLPLGWFAPHFRGETEGRFFTPFPVHIQALIGTLSVLWLFRLVGLWWLVQGGMHVFRRLGG